MAAATAIRLILIPIAAATGSLLLVGSTGLGCGVAELAIFVIQMQFLGGLGLRSAAGGLLRLALGVALAVALVGWSGLGWSWLFGAPDTAQSLWIALLHLLLLGGIVTLSIFGSVGALWWASGLHDGPEKIALNAIRGASSTISGRMGILRRTTQSNSHCE